MKANVVIRHYVFIVTWVNCGYAWVRKGHRVEGTLLVEDGCLRNISCPPLWCTVCFFIFCLVWA